MMWSDKVRTMMVICHEGASIFNQMHAHPFMMCRFQSEKSKKKSSLIQLTEQFQPCKQMETSHNLPWRWFYSPSPLSSVASIRGTCEPNWYWKSVLTQPFLDELDPETTHVTTDRPLLKPCVWHSSQIDEKKCELKDRINNGSTAGSTTRSTSIVDV
jgi:hypothetical protein